MRARRIASAISCLLTLCVCYPSEQIPLVGGLAETYRTPTNRAVSTALYVELEELARVVDITYCVGAVGLGVHKPFECPNRCSDFENFELVTVCLRFFYLMMSILIVH
jgi:hypothetical protein